MYIAKAAGIQIAEAYDQRIRKACHNLVAYPNGGTPRDDLGPGVRTIAIERRVIIAYEAQDDIIRVLHVVYGGRDIGAIFSSADGASDD